MAAHNLTTATATKVHDKYAQRADIGRPVAIPPSRLDQVAMIFRVLIALSEDDSHSLIGEDYEVLARGLSFYKDNIDELALCAREVLSDAHR